MIKFQQYEQGTIEQGATRSPESNRLAGRLGDEEIAAHAMISLDTMQADLVLGTADEVISRLKLGYGANSFWNTSFEKKTALLEHAITKVILAFEE